LPKNQKITFVAVLKAEPKITDKYQILTFADSKIYASLYPGFSLGDRLKIGGKINDTGAMFYPKIEKIGEEKSLFGFLGSLRQRIFRNLSKLLPEKEAVLLQGTVLGVDSIPKDFKDQLINTGTIHVVVVSGQNLAIAAGVFMAFAKYIGRRKALVMASCAVILYGALAGFSAPVMRAVVMVLVSSIAVYFGREVWPVWSLILAALVIIFIDPTAISGVSFQLTFAASLGIMTLGKWMENIARGSVGNSSHLTPRTSGGTKLGQQELVSLRALGGTPSVAATPRLRRIYGLFLGIGAVPLSAYIFTLPIIFFNFGRISFVAPLVNVLVSEAVAPIMFLGFLVSFASLVFMPFAQILAYLAFIPAFYFVKVVEMFSKISVGNF
jgi:competence protein ComEC